MKLDNQLRHSLEENLKPIFGSHIEIRDFKPVGGGCINNGGQLITNEGSFFIKYNRQEFEGMFEAEAKGLEKLREADALHVPQVYTTGNTSDNRIFIVMEWIETGSKRSDFWETFGKGLGAIHQVSNATFGLDIDNYIGSLPQYNTPHENWPDFFINERIERQIAIGKQRGSLPEKTIKNLRALYPKFEKFFPEEPPALLHGDLWGGNYMVDEAGEPVLIDPAVYFGHREMELAFTQMFGGFSGEFYKAYHEVYPLSSDFEERIPVYNLYPLLVHVNLFGGPYLSELEAVVKRFL